MKDKTVACIRAFNRFYLPEFDLLGDSYLGSEYSTAEVRVLFEVYIHDGCTASSIARTMHLDKSYLSRVIRGHERKGYLYRKISAIDNRAYELHLTEAGAVKARDFIERSNTEIGQKIRNLTDGDCEQLMAALRIVTQILEGCKD